MKINILIQIIKLKLRWELYTNAFKAGKIDYITDRIQNTVSAVSDHNECNNLKTFNLYYTNVTRTM